jgi:hypothetical protein
MVSCRSAPTSVVTAGAPDSPRVLTSHPASASTWKRPAINPVKLAIVAPVVNPTSEPVGSPSKSSSQPAAASSAAAAVGAMYRNPGVLSHALTSQSAAMAAGSVPPITHP